jgi:hypothetical protein
MEAFAPSMPQASHKTLINAPFSRVSELLVDKMEKPKKYVGGILFSKILERGDGYIIREMYEPKPVDLTIREKIYRRTTADCEEYVYEHLNNARYTGSFRNVLTRVPGNSQQVALEYIMDWTPHPGTPETLDAESAQRIVTRGVSHMKELAEHPPQVPDFVRAFYGAVDSLQATAMEPLLTDNIRFRIASHNEILGKARVIQLNGEVMKSWTSIKHHFVDVYHDRGRTFVECFVDYTLLDGSEYMLPFLSVFEQEGGKISSIKVYGDLSPLHHGWPGVPKTVAKQ